MSVIVSVIYKGLSIMSVTTKLSPINHAVTILREGGLVAFPTETVYGLGADATNEEAVYKIFQAKERPYHHPLIVHLTSAQMLPAWASAIPEAAYTLAKAFWPGPLTMVLKKQPHVLGVVTGDQNTIGVRVPRHPVAQRLISTFGKGIAAPSANKFTHISPTTVAAVEEELGDSVNFILDGGQCDIGLESTIINLTSSQPCITRPGRISVEAVSNVLGMEVIFEREEQPTIRTPGMHHLHYAPITITLLVATADILASIQHLQQKDLSMAIMSHSAIAIPETDHIKHIRMPREPEAYAHDLYQTLRTLDNKGYARIIVEAVPLSADWAAVHDRLRKASRIESSL